MKFARFQTGGQIQYGIAEGENIREIQCDLFGDHTPTGMVYAINTVKLLVPCTPSKLLALGLNYALHVAESGTGRKPPERPEIFYKVPSSLCHPGDPIMIPPGAGETHFEGEFVAVIGKTARRVPVHAALDYVFGYTCGNDVSARPWQRGDLQVVAGQILRHVLLLSDPGSRLIFRTHPGCARDTPEWAGQAALGDKHAEILLANPTLSLYCTNKILDRYGQKKHLCIAGRSFFCSAVCHVDLFLLLHYKSFL